MMVLPLSEWILAPIPNSAQLVLLLVACMLFSLFEALKNHQKLSKKQRDLTLAHRSLLHELRTPLVAMTYVLDTMQENKALEADAGNHADSVALLRLMCLEALGNVTTTLDEANMWEHTLLVKEDMQLHTFFHNVKDSFAPLANAKQVELLLELPAEGATWVSTQVLALRHCLNNLIDNALKFTTTGSVVVRVSFDETSRPLEQPCLVIQVCDSGFGLSNPSNAIPSTSLVSPRSHGLGLKLVETLVKKLGQHFFIADRQDGIRGTVAELRWGVRFDATKPSCVKHEPLLFLTQDVCECGVELRGLFKATGFDVDLITYPAAPPSANALAPRIKSTQGSQQGVWYLCTYGLDYQQVEKWLTGFKAMKLGVPLIIAISEDASINQLLVRFQRGYLGSCQLIHSSQDVYPALRVMAHQKKANVVPFAKPQSTVLGGASQQEVKRIVIIEDHLVQQLMLAQLLTRQGYWVEVQSHVPTLKEWQGKRADAIFMDLSMLPPNASVRITHCKAIQQATGCKMLYLTSASPLSFEETELLNHEPHLSYVQKPVSPIVLKHLFETALLDDEGEPLSTEPSALVWNINLFMESFGDSKALHIKLIEVFKEEFEEKHLAFQHALSTGQIKEALHMLHQLNGLAAYIQAEDLRRKGLRLEATLEAMHLEAPACSAQEVAGFVASWEDAYHTCCIQQLNPYYEGLKAHAPTSTKVQA